MFFWRTLLSLGIIVSFSVCGLAQETSKPAHAGDYKRGKALFQQRACAACHAVDGKSLSLGPDLSKPEDGKPLTRAQFLEAINEPSKKIRKGYESYSVALFSGEILTGRIIKQSDEAITLASPTATQEIKETEISRDDIDLMKKKPVSVMPKRLLKGMPQARIDDLLAYLESINDPNFVEPTKVAIPEKLPGIDLEPAESDSTFYSPEESMKRIHLAPGFRLELVAAEPMIEEPVLCVWDGDSRMYVAEFRTYMQDADGTDQDLPKSRVSMLEDTDGDGRMDKVSRFVENLVLPRMLLPLDDRIIINETYTEDYYAYRDTDGDGVADEKTLLYGGGKAGGNLEHQNSAMMWGIDNWIYCARTGYKRHRFVGGEWKWERIYGDNGQWGLAMDDVGRFFLSTAGGERPAYGFQQLPQYGKLSLPGERENNFEAVYPIVKMVDVQGGLGRVDKKRGALNRFTGCAGQSIFRGDKMPADFNGDYILPEPVGRLVRRAKVTNIDGKYVLSNAYENSEFIASTDKNFRPLWSATGPDGCLYIVDMYRGIIQEGNWTRKGSYLRGVIDKEGFAKNIGRGRIYRVVHESTKREAAPKMLGQETHELVEHLSHPNGWRRDTAQKLLVLRGDRAAVPLLETLARESASPLARMHALWTLDGLGVSSKSTVMAAMEDSDTRVKLAAIRISESMIPEDDEVLGKVGELGYDEDMTVVVQSINSLRYGQTKASRATISELAGVYPESDLVMASAQSSLTWKPGGGGPSFANFSASMLQKMRQGYQAYTLVCIRCHGSDGNGAVSSDGLQLAPPLVNSPRLLGPPELSARILLHGLTGPVDGKKYPGVMESMKRQDDKWISSALTFARNSFGNSAPAIEPSDIARVRRATSSRNKPYTIEDFAAYDQIPIETLQQWTFTSNSKTDAKLAVDGDLETRFDSAAFQKPGQWFQFDMAEDFELTNITLDATGSDNDYPRNYEIRISDDGQTWSEPVASRSAKSAKTSIGLVMPTAGRFVRIIQTGKARSNYWSIHEMNVFGRSLASRPGDFEEIVDELPDEKLRLGQSVYQAACIRCHGRSGRSRIDGDLKPLGSPLDGRSRFVRNRDALIRVTLRGLQAGESHCPGLLPAEQSDNVKVAALLSYIRQQFNQNLSGIAAEQIATVSSQLPEEIKPFSRDELAGFLPIDRETMKTWKLSASHGANTVKMAIDGNPNSRYSTNAYMKPGMWFAIDFQKTYAIRSIILDTTKSSGDFPRGYSVFVSENGTDWGEPILQGKADTAVTELTLAESTVARHIKVEQTGKFNLFWSIHELEVYGAAK
ncbi:MAG: hypothetical protein CMJ78_15540 [Planctomycetaceae bacterium]|nr:hypothetical protein [Planctomycetaceae bacterium]